MSHHRWVNWVRASGCLGALFGVLACGNADSEPPSNAANDRAANDTVAKDKAATPNVANPTLAATSSLPRGWEKPAFRREFGIKAKGVTANAAAEHFKNERLQTLGLRSRDLVSVPASGFSASGATAFTGSFTSQRQSTGSGHGIGLMYDAKTGKHKFRLYTYQQERDGIPVFRSSLRVLVREEADHPVVWVNSSLKPLDAFDARAARVSRAVDLRASLDALLHSKALAKQPTLAPTALTAVGTPRATIFAGTELVNTGVVKTAGQNPTPRLALQYSARNANGLGKWTFVADAETGEVLHVENNLHFDVSGTVQGEVTTGTQAMECGELGVVPLPYAQVTSDAATAYADELGAFALASSGSDTVSVESTLRGLYFDVINDNGSNSSLTQDLTPLEPGSFVHSDDASPPEFVLAQVNAYKHANDVRRMLLHYVPEYPLIAEQTHFPIHVNRSDMTCEFTGGAWYDDDSAVRSLNFCQRTAERSNTAFGNIVHHEYGHHIVDSGGSAQNEYGEGMADTIAMLFTKDPALSVGYFLNDCTTPLRRGDRHCEYSATDCSTCGSGLYECGALLSGTIWDIWQALDVTVSNADDVIRSLVLSSIPLHEGDGIDASIAVDLLTLDDDDALLENGTPHYAQICAGFELHGMTCPPIVDGLVVQGVALDAEGPSEGPFEPATTTFTLHNLGPQASLDFALTTSADAPWVNVEPASGSIALGDSVTVSVSIVQEQAALLSDGDYTATLSFVNETSGVGNTTREVELRVGAPSPIYTATFTDGLDGFTIDSEYGNLWHNTTSCVDAQPGHSSGGSLYYGKDEVCNYTTPVPILHTITSPDVTINNPNMAELGFKYFLATENDPNYDSAQILVSVNGGEFQVVASNNVGGAKLQEGNAWQELRVELAPLLAAGSNTIRIKAAFNAFDPNNNTKLGFALDDITVYAKVDGCEVDADCDDGDECTSDVCEAAGCTHTDAGTCNVGNPFIETNGQVVIEAENFEHNTPRGNHRWARIANARASGAAVMLASPNVNVNVDTNYATSSPELNYAVRFATPGTYYVWLRGAGPSANDDSCHVGVDGSALSSADRISGFNSTLNWSRNTMDGPVASMVISSRGVHVVNVWMREDGFSLDKLILSTNPNFVPTGNGPTESTREGVVANPCDGYCTNPVVFTSSNHQSGNLSSNASCHETKATLSGGVCGNLSSSRQLFVNGVQMPCNWTPWPSLPAAKNGGYCITTTSGDYPWAAFATW